MHIGIDIGGTTLLAGLVSDWGEILHKSELPTNAQRGYDEIERDVIALIESLINHGKEEGKSVESIGIGIPGIADIESNNVIYCTNLGWHNVPLGLNLKEKFNLPVYIDNDATVAGLAENVKGGTRGTKNSIFLTIGTGIGGGIIIDRKVYSGSHGIGSEIGHMIVGENFYDCNCGSNGCLETFSSSTAIINYTKHLLKENNKSSITDAIGGDLEKLDAKIIFDCAKAGDSLANKVVDRMIKYLSIGIGNLINIMDPEVIAIGGGVSKAGDFLLSKIREKSSNHVVFKSIKHANIVLAELGNDAGIVGAAMLFKYK